MQEAWKAQELPVPSLGQEDPLEADMETHSRILAWRIPWTEEPGGLQSIRSQRIELDSVIDHTCTSIGDTCRNFCINAFSKLVTGIYTKF